MTTCKHNHDAATCIRCDPWMPRNIDPAEADRLQALVDAPTIKVFPDTGRMSPIAKRFETLKLMASGFHDEEGNWHEPLISQSQFLDLLEEQLTMPSCSWCDSGADCPRHPSSDESAVPSTSPASTTRSDDRSKPDGA